MLNPDGVIVGNYRCSLSGRDLNRNYKTILKDAYPSIWHTREMIKRSELSLRVLKESARERFRFMNETELVLYCDFHGHSRKQNVFIYGCENKQVPEERLKERIFPAMLSKNDPSKVRLRPHFERPARICLSLVLILVMQIQSAEAQGGNGTRGDVVHGHRQ